MQSIMSQASIEEDQRIAREYSRQLNANPRRASVLQLNPQMPGPRETPMPKRRIVFKSPIVGLPITPISMTSTPTEARSNGFEITSSSLSSLHSSGESSSNDASPSMMLRANTMCRELPDRKPVSFCRAFTPRGHCVLCTSTLIL
jgi:hypothetical protein